MLTIQPGINQNTYLNPAFTSGKKRNKVQKELSPEEIERRKAASKAELEARIAEEEEDKFRSEKSEWEKSKEGFERTANEIDGKIPKPVKVAAKTGAILAGGVLTGMATGWSARYIIELFQKMGKTNTVQALGRKLKQNIAEPAGKAFKAVKKAVSKQIKEMKKSDTYISYNDKYTEIANKYKNSSFNKSLQKVSQKLKDNKIVKFIDNVFNKIADGVMLVYENITGTGFKTTVANITGVAGGTSAVAMEVLKNVKPAPEQNDTPDTTEIEPEIDETESGDE